MHQIDQLKSSEKDFSRQFYPKNYDHTNFCPKNLHDWQVTERYQRDSTAIRPGFHDLVLSGMQI